MRFRVLACHLGSLGHDRSTCGLPRAAFRHLRAVTKGAGTRGGVARRPETEQPVASSARYEVALAGPRPWTAAPGRG